MRKINNILFPTDFSETAQNAFRYCLCLADHYAAEITLLHVIYPEYEMLDLPVMAVKATRDKAEAGRNALSSFIELGVGQVQEQLLGEPIVHIQVEVGTPVAVIMQQTKQQQPDLIIMGTKGEHNALEKTLGSVTTGVIEEAGCPVIVIPEHAAWKAPQIVAFATDLSEADPYHVWRSAQMLAPFHPLMHVVHIANDKTGNLDRGVNLLEVEDFFNRHGNNTPALQITFHELKRESVTSGLEEFIDTYEIDMLVMFAPKHTWLDRMFKASTTKKMAHDAPVPLLLLKS